MRERTPRRRGTEITRRTHGRSYRVGGARAHLLLALAVALALATPGSVALADEHLAKPAWDGSQRLTWSGPNGQRYVLGLSEGTWHAELTSTVPAEAIGSPAVGIRLVPVADDPHTYLLRLRGELPAFDRLAIDAREDVPAADASRHTVRVPVDKDGRLLLIDAAGPEAGEYRLAPDGTPYAVFHSTVKGLRSRVQEDGHDIPAEWDPNKGVVLLRLTANEQPRRADLLLHVEPLAASPAPAQAETTSAALPQLGKREIADRLLELLRTNDRTAYNLLTGSDEPAEVPIESSGRKEPGLDQAATAGNVWIEWAAVQLDVIVERFERGRTRAAAEQADRVRRVAGVEEALLKKWAADLAQQLRIAEERRAHEAASTQGPLDPDEGVLPDDAVPNTTDESRPAVVIAQGGQRPAEVVPGDGRQNPAPVVGGDGGQRPAPVIGGDGGQTLAPVLPDGEGCVSGTPSLGQAQASAPCAGQVGQRDASVVNPTWLGETGADPVLGHSPLPAPLPAQVLPTDPGEPGREPEPEVAETPVQQASELIEPEVITLLPGEPDPATDQPVEPRRGPETQVQPEVTLGGTGRVQPANPSVSSPIAKPGQPDAGPNLVQGGGFGFLAE